MAQFHYAGCQHINNMLGVNISNNLSWSPYIANITAKANSKMGFIWRNLKHCPKELREQAYIALVHLVIEYANAVWDPHLRKDITSLEQVQWRAARFTTGDSDWGSSVTKMIKDLGWESLEYCRRNIRLALLGKIVGGRQQSQQIIFSSRQMPEREQNTPTSSGIWQQRLLHLRILSFLRQYLSGMPSHERQ